jgi:hypothetical protein
VAALERIERAAKLIDTPKDFDFEGAQQRLDQLLAKT